jgi:hypothetical protein
MTPCTDSYSVKCAGELPALFAKLGAFVLPLITAATPSFAAACSCAPDEYPYDKAIEHNFAESSFVGVASVKKIERKKSKPLSDRKATSWARMDIGYVFKGTVFVGQELVAEIPSTTSSCKVDIRTGQIFLIYAKDIKTFRLSYCGASGDLFTRFRDLSILFKLTEKAERP